MMTSYWISQSIFAAARLGIADLLADGPVGCKELAVATDSHAPSLYRLLRALASIGIFTESSPQHFALTELAELLRSGAPDSMRALAFMEGSYYTTWAEMLHSVKTGEPAFNHLHGMGIFDYLAQNPATAQLFNESMTGVTHRVGSAVSRAYDFSPFETVVDVGGGHGALLAAILRSSPGTRGILFDQPHMVAGAEHLLSEAGVLDRCTRVGGDFFDAVPAGGNAYVLAQILHDWDDDRSTTILTQCRKVVPVDGRLLVVEIVVPPGDEPSFGKWIDLQMLVMAGGRERTAPEYEGLFLAT